MVQSWGGHRSLAELTDLLPGLGAKPEATSSLTTLVVPVSIAGRVSCALVVESRGRRTGWTPPLIERLRLDRRDPRQRAAPATSGALAPRDGHAARATDAPQLEAANRYLQEEIKSYHDVDEIVGQSAALRVALTRLMQVASMNSTVLLLGETGTGKELFARALHDRSRRHARALVRVNCAALPPSLIESELFGHERGAFTGAVSMRQGRFEIADGGTIFLDEIGDLPLELQAKLLRVIQEGEFERVGSSRTRKVDVRVITATHRNLEQEVAEGRFRADLFYRLSVFPINLPALRERTEDIPALVWFFIHRHQRELERRITKVPQAVMVGAPAARLAGQHPRARERGRARHDSHHRRHAAARRRGRYGDAPAGGVRARIRWTRFSGSTSNESCGSAGGGSTARATPPNGSASTRTRCGSGCRSWASSARAGVSGGRRRAPHSAYRDAGRRNVKRPPCPSSLSHDSVPPMRSRKSFTITRPNPVDGASPRWLVAERELRAVQPLLILQAQSRTLVLDAARDVRRVRHHLDLYGTTR